MPGEIDAAHDNHLANDSAEDVQRFGTQRYHVRIELYDAKKGLIPDQVVRSWGVADLKQQVDRFPTVRMTLPGVAGPACPNISFGFVEGEGLMMMISDIACSSGSACTSASLEPSYVLRALGLSDERARASLRVGIGRFTSAAEIDLAIEEFVTKVRSLRAEGSAAAE